MMMSECKSDVARGSERESGKKINELILCGCEIKLWLKNLMVGVINFIAIFAQVPTINNAMEVK
jgi:hypothetical protein